MIMINREELVRGRKLDADSTQCILTGRKEKFVFNIYCSRMVLKTKIRTEGG